MDDIQAWQVKTSQQHTSVSQKPSSLRFSDIFAQTIGSFLVQILHTYYVFLSMRDYKVLSKYLQFWRNYAILSATTQFTPYVQNVHHWPKCTLAFSDIFPKQLGIFGPNFTHLWYVPIYARLQNFMQLTPTVTKLCHIKCDHPASVLTDGGHFEHLMVVVLNIV